MPGPWQGLCPCPIHGESPVTQQYFSSSVTNIRCHRQEVRGEKGEWRGSFYCMEKEAGPGEHYRQRDQEAQKQAVLTPSFHFVCFQLRCHHTGPELNREIRQHLPSVTDD